MKTLYKTAAIVGLLAGLAVATQAQVLIGSFQGASDPLNAGWIDVQTGQPITSSTNASFVAAGVPGYPLSLDMSAAGHAGSFGYPTLELQFSPAQIAAFNTNSWITFTFSVPAWTNGGYSQIYNLVLNASGYGYNNQNWANALEMGDTNSTTPGSNPNFYFYNGVPLQTMVVSYNYSSVTDAIMTNGEGYLQLTFQGNQGGGAPTDMYFNSVVLSQAPFGAAPGNPSIIIDQFNPTNNPYAGTNIYAAGEITNVYGFWFGNAITNSSQITWDTTNDANGNTSSGSLKLTAYFSGVGSQWVITDAAIGSGTGPGITPPITNYLSLLTFEFDLMYAPGSPTWINGGTTNYGNLEWGIAGGPVGGYSGGGYGAVQYNVTNTGWVHEVIQLNPRTDADFASIGNIFFKQDGGSYGALVGTSTLWLDNLKFTYTNIPPVILPPTVSILPTYPALRIFAGSTVNTYDREELATVDDSQSWISPTEYPVSYSFTLLSYPNNNINQTHIFLVPVNTSGQGNMGNSGLGANEYIEYQATNALWLALAPNGGGSVTASVLWKTNLPNANPNQTALVFTNPTAIGTWTLTFSNANSGAVTGPGSSPQPFTITNGTITTDFANPLVAYFGLQPNSTAGEGLYEDWASILVTNVAGANEAENFTTEPSRGLSAAWANNSAVAGSLVVVSTNDMPAYWVNWTIPAINFAIGTKTNLLSGTWINPAYYSGYYDETAPYGMPSEFGTKMWVMLPKDDLPTVDGSQNGVPAPISYFLVATNVVSP